MFMFNIPNVMLSVSDDISYKHLLMGVLMAYNVKIKPSSINLQNKINKLIIKAKTQPLISQQVKEEIRNLLRSGGFKPAGRSKPASEYLEQCAINNQFPIINNLVDINNYISLYYGVPISLLDLDVLSSQILIRYGKEGESYVFNNSGQNIDLKGLLTVCKETSQNSIPLGSPVKDSMQAKIKNITKNVIYIVYLSSKIFNYSDLCNILDEIELMVSQEALTQKFHSKTIQTF